MKRLKENFGKYEKIMTRLERLTEQAFKNPSYMKKMKETEDELCAIIKKEQCKKEKPLIRNKRAQRKAA